VTNDQPIEAWTPLEVGTATLFGIVATLNAVRFGFGVEAAADLAASAAVLIPRQLRARSATIS